jgi:hypothetical protein
MRTKLFVAGLALALSAVVTAPTTASADETSPSQVTHIASAVDCGALYWNPEKGVS